MVMSLSAQQIRHIISFILFLLAFMILLNMVTPVLFRALPNDYMRTKLIIQTLKDTSEVAEVIILGNSRGMNGVNGYMLEKELSDHPKVYNLTSTGQQLSESALYYTMIPTEVKTVIQCIDIDLLSKPIDIKTSNSVALHMYRYEMDNKTEEIVPLKKTLDKPFFIYNYEARNCLFAGLSYFLRKMLDDDDPDVFALDLRYPSSHKSLRNDIIYKQEIEEKNKNNMFALYTILPEWKKLIDTSYIYFKQRNIRYCLLIMPYNPDIISSTNEEKEYALSLFKKQFNDIFLIDCFNLLRPEDFYDAIHPNNSGAEKITDMVIKSF